MRMVLLTILSLVSLTSFASPGPLSTSELKDLLARIRENRITQADFEEQRFLRLMKKPIASSGRVWFQPPNKFRREVKGNSPSLTVSNGQQLWIYYPNFKSAEYYSIGARSPLDSIIAAINSALNLENVENAFDVTGTKIDNAYELDLTPRTPSMKRILQKLHLRIDDKLRA